MKISNKTIISAIAAAVAVTACSSAPVPKMPSGGDRQLINSQKAIEAWTVQTATAREDINQRHMLEQRVAELNREVSSLKSYLQLLQAQWKYNAELKSRPAAVRRIQRDDHGAAPGGKERVAAAANSVIFYMSHGFARTEFNPSTPFAAELLSTAKVAKQIEIRGRTDARASNPVDQRIASARAVNAREFLVQNGVSPRRIKWSALAAGDHIADNNTVAGRAMNRRVEIEASGIDYAALGATNFQLTHSEVQ